MYNLINAVLEGDIEKVKDLIERGADLEFGGEDGCTPLIRAAEEGYMEIVKLLIEEGADINAKVDTGSAALIASANEGQTEVVKIFIQNGANISDSEWRKDKDKKSMILSRYKMKQ